MRKLMDAGDHHHDQAEDAYASVPRTMIAKTAWTMRIGKIRPVMKLILDIIISFLGVGGGFWR